MEIDQDRDGYQISHNTGLLAYLFPFLVPTRFNLETSLTADEAGARLQDLERVTVQRRVPRDWARANAPNHYTNTNRKWVMATIRPIEVRMKHADPETIRYNVVVNEERFRMVIWGFIRNRDTDTSVVSGVMRFKVHILGYLLYTVICTIIGVGAIFITSGVLNKYVTLAALRPLAHNLQTLLAKQQNQYALVTIVAVIMLVLVWFGTVVFYGHRRRREILMRLEDMMTSPFLG